MNDRELENMVRNIIEDYIDILERYERTFRDQIAKRAVGYGITEGDLIRLPQEIFSLVRDYHNEWFMHDCFSDLSDKYAKTYYEKTLESFAKSGKILNDDEINGTIFETLLLDALRNIKGMNVGDNINTVDNLNKLKSKLDYEGVGLKGKHGDIEIILKGVNMPMYIDAKYSTDRSIIISKTEEKFSNTYDVWQEILEEIQRGIEESIAYDKKRGGEWVSEFIHGKSYRDFDTKMALEHYTKGFLVPKILIYIFKDRGSWSSEVLEELEDRVVANAQRIQSQHGITKSGENFSKSWLWYGGNK